jgi:anaerobic ribonucleoside-triphosphate reductase activating protein
MRYHNITKDDMLNGSGLRVVLWLSSCSHRCEGCHNSETWSCNSGILFDSVAKEEIFRELEKDHISGLTFSGGDPLHENNTKEVKDLIMEIKQIYPKKDIWLYTGYYYNDIVAFYPVKYEVVKLCDVLVDGRYVKELSDVNYHWAGSTNQSVIDIKKTLENNENIVLLEN